MLGRVERVGREYEIVERAAEDGRVAVRPIEGAGRDGAGSREGGVFRDVGSEVGEDGGEVGEVGAGGEEGGGG